MSSTLAGVLILLISSIVVIVGLRIVLRRIAGEARRAGVAVVRVSRGTLEAISTGGVNLVADDVLELAETPRTSSEGVLGKVLAAISTGGISLFSAPAPTEPSASNRATR